LVIVFGTWDLLLESVKLAISAVPSNINIEAVDNYLRNLPGVIQTRDLHIWGMSTTETALTVHLVMPAGYPGDPFLNDVTSYLSHEFDIAHVTIQVQQGAIKSVCDSIAVG
jgi:cobalt-zinc-cadmium efflux system protein